MIFARLTGLGAAVREALASFHPFAPWALVFFLAAFFDEGLRKLGFVRWVKGTYPWGDKAAEALSSLPTVIFFAAFPALTSGGYDATTAVKTAVVSVFASVVLAIKANIGPKPPSGGAGIGAAMLVSCALTACGQGSRPPTRDACYLAAESHAFQRGVKECAAYESTDVCPVWPEIDAEMQRSQEACK